MKRSVVWTALALASLLFAAVLTGCPNLENSTEPPPDTSALEVAIVTAKAVQDGVPVAAAASEVAQGLHYITQAELDAINNAITAAETVKNDAAAAQTDVDRAAVTLTVAVTAFNTAKASHTGTKTAGFTGSEKNELLLSAAAAKSGVKTSRDGSDIASTDLWVMPAVMTLLNDAITALNGDSSDENYITLVSTLAVFNAAKQAGTKAEDSEPSAPAVDKGALQLKIAEAGTAKDSVVIAENAGQAAQGTKWATQAQADSLDATIAEAQNTASAAVNQEAVDSAAGALNAAIAAFNTAVDSNGPGTKAAGFSQDEFTALKEKANAAKTGIKVSINGDDVPPVGVWVVQAVLDTLNAAIASAETTVNDGVYLALSNAVDAFNDAKQPGSTPDKLSLLTVIVSAGDARTGVAIAAARDQAPLGSAWVTQAQWDALNTVYAASMAAANKEDATKNEVAEAKTALDAAIAAFISVKTANGAGTANGSGTAGENSIAVSGLGAVYANGASVTIGIANSKTDDTHIAYGQGTIVNGSLGAVSLQDTNGGSWTGSGSYYAGFSVDGSILFVSKARVAFNGNAVTAAYGDFELFTHSIPLEGFGVSGSMTLDAFISMASRGELTSYNDFKAWIPNNVTELFEIDGSKYKSLSALLDYNYYKDAACAQEFKGTDTVAVSTVIYAKLPFGDLAGTMPGPGTDEILSSPEALEKIGVDPDFPLDGKYTLGADLTLEDWKPIGTASKPFTGIFNGNGKTVTINNGSGGIFGFTEGAAISNLTVTGTINVEGNVVYVGGIAGRGIDTSIASCKSNVSIIVDAQGHNSSAGGIAGFLSGACEVVDCHATGDITLRSEPGQGLMLYGGGVAGYQGLIGAFGGAGEVSDCVIKRCSFTGGAVTVEGGYPYAGGVLGYNYTGATLRESYAAGGSVTAKGENLPYAGGVAGYNSRGETEPSFIENCYSDMTVNGDASSRQALAGGVAGSNAAWARISKCYARGSVTAAVVSGGSGGTGGTLGVLAAANAGGIAGSQYVGMPSIDNCVALNTGVDGRGGAYNVRRIAGEGSDKVGSWAANIAGAPLYHDGQAVEPGAATADGFDGADCAAKPDQSAFEALGWDFASVWKMGADGYPVLRWQP